MPGGISWLTFGDPAITVRDAAPGTHAPRLTLVGGGFDFRILGPVEVFRGAERLQPGGHQHLAVLARLTMDVGRVVSVDGLVEGLWGERAPADARATLQTYVCKLRRVLEPDRRPGTGEAVIRTRSGGYVLEVDPDAVDAHRFLRLADNGREALAAGHAEAAIDLFGEALALWRGPALADFAFQRFAALEIARLEEVRLGVSEDRIEASLLLGRHRAVIPDLEQLVATHPFRERLRGQLMVALYRSGRQSEGLRVYHAGWRLLAEELGIQPGPELRKLEEDILRQDASLDWVPPTPVAGPCSVTVAFLRSEVECATGLRSGRAEFAAVFARHDELVATTVASYGGTFRRPGAGAAVLGVFRGAGEALAAALALHRALACERWPDGVAVRLWLGLPTGDAVEEDAVEETADTRDVGVA